MRGNIYVEKIFMEEGNKKSLQCNRRFRKHICQLSYKKSRCKKILSVAYQSSFKEKGLYTAIYLNETMNVDQLVESGKDKADAVRSGLKKLIEKQYIKKSVVREKNGNFVTVYYQVIE